MTRDILRAVDAVNRAVGINAGLDALVALLFEAEGVDSPPPRAIGELIWSVQKDLKASLAEASKHLGQ